MTPEETFQHIENVLRRMADSHVLCLSQMRKLREPIQRLRGGIQEREAAHNLGEIQVPPAAELDELKAAVQDLIIRSRTMLDSQKEGNIQMEVLRDLQRRTAEKLRALIETVDRIIRDQSPQG